MKARLCVYFGVLGLLVAQASAPARAETSGEARKIKLVACRGTGNENCVEAWGFPGFGWPWWPGLPGFPGMPGFPGAPPPGYGPGNPPGYNPPSYGPGNPPGYNPPSYGPGNPPGYNPPSYGPGNPPGYNPPGYGQGNPPGYNPPGYGPGNPPGYNPPSYGQGNPPGYNPPGYGQGNPPGNEQIPGPTPYSNAKNVTCFAHNSATTYHVSGKAHPAYVQNAAVQLCQQHTANPINCLPSGCK